MGDEQSVENFQGTVFVPGVDDEQQVTLQVDKAKNAVSLHFGDSIGGSNDWEGVSVQLTKRLKYDEIIFQTMNLPKETVRLTWKVNASHDDDYTIAGVIVVTPNDQRVTGEKGFILTRQT